MEIFLGVYNFRIVIRVLRIWEDLGEVLKVELRLLWVCVVLLEVWRELLEGNVCDEVGGLGKLLVGSLEM